MQSTSYQASDHDEPREENVNIPKQVPSNPLHNSGVSAPCKRKDDEKRKLEKANKRNLQLQQYIHEQHLHLSSPDFSIMNKDLHHLSTPLQDTNFHDK